jgi:flagellar motility protein MotE (MotC chaperone)
VQTDTIDSDDEAVKSKNLVQYTTYKLEKRKRKLEREIDTQKEKLKTISTKIGHYFFLKFQFLFLRVL